MTIDAPLRERIVTRGFNTIGKNENVSKKSANNCQLKIKNSLNGRLLNYSILKDTTHHVSPSTENISEFVLFSVP